MTETMKRTCVLLVEDEVLISDLISEALTEYGFEVHAFMSGLDALAYLKGDDSVDVLFTDINLHGDMDGTELARRARALRPDLAVVYASGRYCASSVAPLVPRSRFLSKPYDPGAVCMLLDRLAAH